MRTEPLGPYRLTLAELEAMPVSAERRQLRQAIRDLESTLRNLDADKHGMVKIDEHHELAQPTHHIMPGVYIREMHLFPGLVVVGKRHAQQHFSIITHGSATVTTEAGTQVIQGPCQFMSPAGTKRALWVHEPMVWMTVHRTDATSLEEAEAELMISEEVLEMEVA